MNGKKEVSGKSKIDDGIIEEVLPRLMFRVRLADGRVVRASAATSVKHATVRLIAGARVQVAGYASDPDRAQIVRLYA